MVIMLNAKIHHNMRSDLIRLC